MNTTIWGPTCDAVDLVISTLDFPLKTKQINICVEVNAIIGHFTPLQVNYENMKSFVLNDIHLIFFGVQRKSFMK